VNPAMRLRATDDPAGHPRTTGTLVASLAARLGALGYVSGGQAIGSQLAGIAALGKEVSQTEHGRRLRTALRHTRAAGNGEVVWRALRIGAWLSTMPPSPVLDELRNDLALLLADDLDQALDTIEEVAPPLTGAAQPQRVDFADLMVGLWAWGRELANSVETAAGLSAFPPEVHDGDDPVPNGPLLR
jgi:hypothetical protein